MTVNANNSILFVRIKMNVDLAQQAVQHALNGNWHEAAALNKQIVKDNKNDTEALNRLAKAYFQLGKTKKAISISKKVLKIDPFNSIATKCIDKWKTTDKKNIKLDKASARLFIEEPGKTKIVSLINLGAPKLRSSLDCGEEVNLNISGHKISVTTSDGKYLGKLPDDVGVKLKKLITLGNEYKVLVKTLDTNEVKVIIREIKTSPMLTNTPSFTAEKINYISFTPPELVHSRDIEIPTEED